MYLHIHLYIALSPCPPPLSLSHSPPSLYFSLYPRTPPRLAISLSLYIKLTCAI